MDVRFDLSGKALRVETLRAAKRAGSSALRAARAQASREVRTRKALRLAVVNKALRVQADVTDLEWRLTISGAGIPLAAYPHRQTAKGVSVRVNRGGAKLIQSAFLATMRSGHRGVFARSGELRLPIKELYASRVVDVFGDPGAVDAVLGRADVVFRTTFARNLK